MRANVLANGPLMVSLAAAAKRVMPTTDPTHKPSARIWPTTTVPAGVWPMASRSLLARVVTSLTSVMCSGPKMRLWMASDRGRRR